MPAPKIITSLRKSARIKRNRRPSGILETIPETSGTPKPWSLGVNLSPLYGPTTPDTPSISPRKRFQETSTAASSPGTFPIFDDTYNPDILVGEYILDHLGIAKMREEMTKSLHQALAEYVPQFDVPLFEELIDRWTDPEYDVDEDPDPEMAEWMREFFRHLAPQGKYHTLEDDYVFYYFALQKAWNVPGKSFHESEAARAFRRWGEQWQGERKLNKRSLDDSLASSPVTSRKLLDLSERVKAEPRAPRFPFVTPPQSPTKMSPSKPTSTAGIDMSMGLGNFLGFSSPLAPASPTKGSPTTTTSPKATTPGTGTTLLGNLFGFSSPPAPSSPTKGTMGFSQPQPQPDSTSFWPYATPSSYSDDHACYRPCRRRSTSKKRKRPSQKKRRTTRRGRRISRRASSKRKRTKNKCRKR